jgi:hypothetical protein
MKRVGLNISFAVKEGAIVDPVQASLKHPEKRRQRLRKKHSCLEKSGIPGSGKIASHSQIKGIVFKEGV